MGPSTATQSHPRLLSLDDVKAITRLSRASIYRAINRGDLPKPLKVGSRSLWSAAAVDAAIDRMIEEAEADDHDDAA
jgi:prophage regulatory protein